MPRTARIKSDSGIYHVILRGIGQQNIFEEDRDKERFIETLKRYKNEMNFEVHAYCLMDNHVHLLIKDRKDELERIMKRIAGSYAYYFNWKYGRKGHLFGDRFKSEPVQNENYYLTVLRYIHKNPDKAGILPIEKYKWSSYTEYLKSPDLIDTEFAMKLFGNKTIYIQFHLDGDKDCCMEINDTIRLTDDMAKDIIKNIANANNMTQILQYDNEKRDKILKQLKENGLSIRQISRITGINRSVVLKA